MVSLQKCYLDIHNHSGIGDQTVSTLIHKQGKQHLWDSRRGADVDTVVIHHISAIVDHPEDPYNLAYVLQLFCTYGVSSHYLIDRQGIVYALVPEEQKAWHCGASMMPPPDLRSGVNDFSIGIELMGTMDSAYTKQQYDSLAVLCRDIEVRRNIKNYVGHETVAGEWAVSRGIRDIAKTDPGPLFDWQRFRQLRNAAGA